MTWKSNSVKVVTTEKGTYRNIHWTIKKTTINDHNGSKEYMEWGAGLRGSGVADTYERCKECIETKINMC